jgi:hypothetical protein
MKNHEKKQKFNFATTLAKCDHWGNQTTESDLRLAPWREKVRTYAFTTAATKNTDWAQSWWPDRYLFVLEAARRVTRLGEFSPIGQLFTLSNVCMYVVLNFGLLFLRKKICINFVKKMFGLHLGRFFHKPIWPPCCPKKLNTARTNSLRTKTKQTRSVSTRSVAGWPDWTNFRRMGVCILWATCLDRKRR